MSNVSSKLALGSANFGLDYGAANSRGKVPIGELTDILLVAQRASIEFIDTAQAYGDSEARIGSLCHDNQFKFITKIGVEWTNDAFVETLVESVRQSCNRLNQSRLYAVMLHRPESLLGPDGKKIFRQFQTLKEQGIISKIGVSVYSPEILSEIISLFKLDIVQVPFNLFDRRILDSGWSEKLKNQRVEIHTRSVFLQGVLLMTFDRLPYYFKQNWPDQFYSWYQFLNYNEVDALEVSLKFVLQQDWIDKIVVGVDSVAQLKSLVGIERSSTLIDFPELACNDQNLINPSKWDLR